MATLALPDGASAQPGSPSPPEPKGAHPRILLDAELRKAWKAAAADQSTPVARAVRRCNQITASTREFDRDGYMGLDWGHHLQACLVAYVATGKEDFAGTAMRYFTALIDDLVNVGDGKGGDEAARRDSGYSIRALGPYPALAYDWLHDHKLMTEALRRRARQRFAAWTDWYVAKGYRARSPATNYQAGYLMAVTLIAVAQAGEAGPAGAALWRFVVDELWRKDMTKAFAAGGVLDGGDWAEGWQYGPLSVAEYALTLRVMRQHGVALPAAETWPVDLFKRHVYALAPSDRLFVGGDTQSEEPYIEPFVYTLAAVALSDAAPMPFRSYAVAEMNRLKMEWNDFLIFDSLARGVGIKAAPVPKTSWPTWYVAHGTSTLHARTRWDASAVWMVVQCSKTLDVDHFHPNAGNFVVSRGKDDLIVDPAPYGSLSTLTGNAPTVDSPQLPANYRPSQAYWSVKTGFAWAYQTERGVVAARCDYADQYKFQDRPSDVPMAVRDFVLVPRKQGSDATLIIADRADTTSPERELFLRFRSPGKWKESAAGARVELGKSAAALTTLATKTKGSISSPAYKDCFNDKVTRGNCDAARFPTTEYKLTLRGPKPSALQVIELGDGKVTGGGVAIDGRNYSGVTVAHDSGDGGEVTVLWAKAPGEVSYQAKPGATVVVHDAAPAGKAMKASAQKSGDGCKLTVTAGGAAKAPAPLVLQLDERCALNEDQVATAGNAATGALAASEGDAAGEQEATASAANDGGREDGRAAAAAAGAANEQGTAATNDGVPQAPRSPRSGCCGASATASSTFPTALLVGLALLLRRRRR